MSSTATSGNAAAAASSASSSAAAPTPTHVTESISDRRKQRELAEARQSGTAAPEIDVKTGAMINPHNPEFITKRPWYLGGGDAGPSLDHQADQRALRDRVELSLSSADDLLRKQRDAVRFAKKRGLSASTLRVGSWVEALKKNRKPYLMCRVTKVDERRRTVDLEYEDGSVERGVKWATSSRSDKPRIRLTKLGARAIEIDPDEAGKETYDSKRDAYHGLDVEDQQREIRERFKRREELRRQKRKEAVLEEEQMRSRQQQRGGQGDDDDDEEDGDGRNGQGGANKGRNGGGTGSRGDAAGTDGNTNANRGATTTGGGGSDSDADSDSDYDSDAHHGSGSDSEDDFVQKDADAKTFATRLARQGGVGGAQMKVTARNLRIREDTAKYLRNLDPNSAYYDPKSRSMRDNPYPEADPEEVQFAGDNYARISGDAVGLARTQVFAWDATGKGVEELHPQANPSQAELLKRKYTDKSTDLKLGRKRAVLDKYGGAEYLDGADGLGDAGLDKDKADGGGGGTGTARQQHEEAREEERRRKERQVRFGASVRMEQYSRDGRQVKPGGPGSGGPAAHKLEPIQSKYDEDVFVNGHRTVWGSYFHKGAFRWGYADDHSLLRNGYCTGDNGRRANDEANELRYGDGRQGSAQVAQLRQMLGGGAKSSSSAQRAPPPGSGSKMYGEAEDQFEELDRKKVEAAVARQAEEDRAFEGKSDDRKRGYNSLQTQDVDVTPEEMEAYRIKRGRGGDDPMMKVSGDEVLEYKK